MSSLATLGLSMILLLVAFPLISFGTMEGPDALWWLGLLALALGGAIPPLQRFVGARKPEPPPSRIGLRDDERVS